LSTQRRRRASGVCPAPASAQLARVDALVEPEIEERARAGALDLERMLVELYDAHTTYAAASRELEQFLEAGLVSELGPDLYAREVARRREAVNAAAAFARRPCRPAKQASTAWASSNPTSGISEQ
jgi:hypothetical protein